MYLRKGRIYGGCKHLAKIYFNKYVDIIKEFNKNKEKLEAYNKAWEKACSELKAVNYPQSKKHKLSIKETDSGRAT